MIASGFGGSRPHAEADGYGGGGSRGGEAGATMRGAMSQRNPLTASSRGGSSSRRAGTEDERLVDVWAWDEWEAGNGRYDRYDLGVAEAEALRHANVRWAASATLSLTLQLASLHVQAGLRR
jgi:hypothetical protein